MPSEVKMPQLGMNQDSAVIVSWLKAAGDKVAAGDALFEVETDKATMEVEATSDGYLAGVRASEGADVPVGDVIALIVASEAEVAEHAGPAETKTQADEPEVAADDSMTPELPSAKDPAPALTAQRPAPKPAPASARVLASPKARMLAAERGIDLAQLRATGVAEPIHVRNLPAAAAGGQSSLGARIDGAALDSLLLRSPTADRTRLVAAFAARAWRDLFNADDVTVALRGLDGSVELSPNPDLGGRGEARAAALSLVDLCDTRLGSYAPAGGGVGLSLARDGGAYLLTLSFPEATLPLPHAVTLLDDIAARVDNPIRQII